MKTRRRQTAMHDVRRAGGRLRSCDGCAAFVARRDFSFYAWRFS